MKLSFVDCDLKDCGKRVGPLDDNDEHADLAGWIKISMAVFKLNPEEIEEEKHQHQQPMPFGFLMVTEQHRNQVEAEPLNGMFCSWEHAVRWVQGEAVVWQAAEAGR